MIILKKTRCNLLSLLVTSLGVLTVFIVSCEKDDVDTANVVTTAEINYINETSANGGGKI